MHALKLLILLKGVRETNRATARSLSREFAGEWWGFGEVKEIKLALREGDAGAGGGRWEGWQRTAKRNPLQN